MLSWVKKVPPTVGPDYSHVDSIAKAEALVISGELAKLCLLPAAFGGSEVRENTVYVPPFVTEIKQGIDENTVMSLLEEGKVRRYVATPKYQSRSIVPISIEINATEPANFGVSIAIWGDGLKANQGAA
jgi:hypothetical protein